MRKSEVCRNQIKRGKLYLEICEKIIEFCHCGSGNPDKNFAFAFAFGWCEQSFTVLYMYLSDPAEAKDEDDGSVKILIGSPH